MIDASANYVLERVGANLTWKFNGINLPPSVADTTIGKGFITFQIKPKSGYAVGDIIPNKANIYFDTNPAIITDTCNTEFVSFLGNENFAFQQFNYYPNPVKNNLSISNGTLIRKIEVKSILGQIIQTKQVNSLQTDIDLSYLTSGVYFVTIYSESQEKMIKIIKK